MGGSGTLTELSLWPWGSSADTACITGCSDVIASDYVTLMYAKLGPHSRGKRDLPHSILSLHTKGIILTYLGFLHAGDPHSHTTIYIFYVLGTHLLRGSPVHSGAHLYSFSILLPLQLLPYQLSTTINPSFPSLHPLLA